ncbi:MAG TPA: phosphatidylglycerol lysyltransferase domain-containing protein [Herpetosiphonaceae bacterium]
MIGRRRAWRRRIAGLVVLMGCANILSSLVVRVEAREHFMRMLLPLEIERGSRHLAVVAGLALLAVGRGLWRGQRWTWRITIGLLAGSALVHLIKGLDWEEAALALGLVGLLLWRQRDFRAVSDPPTLMRAVRALALSIAGLLVYALIGGVMLQSQFGGGFSWSALFAELGARLLLGTGPLQPQSHRAFWFLESFSVVGVALLAYLIGAFLRPLVSLPAARHEHEQARQLLSRYATSSLAYFALLPDKSLYFGRSVAGVIPYRVAANVAVVCGDPIVAPENLAALLHEFDEQCALSGWELCCYEVQAEQLATYAELGFHTLKIGEDAWIDLKQFSLKGKPIADIRHAVSKIEREGVSFRVLGQDRQDGFSPADEQLWTQMQSLAGSQSRADFELQFSIGQLPATPDPEARYSVALGSDGATVIACCSWLPIYAAGGWALDVMLRTPDAPNGAMEYLIAQSLLAFQQAGAAWASLGVAPLADADVEQDDERSLLQRGVRFLYEHPRVNEFYRYKSLFFFKRKFVPAWRGVYLVYSSRLSLPGTLYAVLKVHLPAIGPRLITDFLRQQGQHNLARWQSWLRTRFTAREHAESPQQ